MIRFAQTAIALLALAALALPASATASPEQALRDCVDGQLDRDYSNSDLRKALDEMPADVDEYSDCREVLRAGMESGEPPGGGSDGSGDGSSGAGGGGDSGGVSGSDARGADQANLDSVIEGYTNGGKRPEVDVGGKTVEPGTNGLFDVASARNGLPLPLVMAIVPLMLLALIAGLVALRERIPALARVPVLSKLSFPRVRLRVPSFLRR